MASSKLYLCICVFIEAMCLSMGRVIASVVDLGLLNKITPPVSEGRVEDINKHTYIYTYNHIHL